jgi:hypothetical protein
MVSPSRLITQKQIIMIPQKSYSRLHGFDGYNIVLLTDSCFCNDYGFYIPYSFSNYSENYIVTKNLSVKVTRRPNPDYSWYNDVVFEPDIATNHVKLLDTAKKVYTHPSCKLSRSMMAEKYKKSLNPFLSDAVIIPKPDYSELSVYKDALFVNDKAKIIVMVRIESDDAKERIKEACEGDKFQKLATCTPNDSYGTRKPYTVDDLLDAEFFYYGDVLCVPTSHSWIIDILTHALPSDKIVYEESVQESLSTASNQLDFDSLCSIKDMLDSSDENTQAAGLKSLSMMDWMHYPNSIKFMMDQTRVSNWRYNKACSSTSVKYMLKTITGTTNRRRWPGSLDTEIYAVDFELFKKLKAHYHHIQPQDVLNHIRSVNFIRVNGEGLLVPNLKSRAA